MAFLGVNELGELIGIADKEHRGVVSHHVPVAFLGVEFERKASHIAFCIRRATFARYG